MYQQQENNVNECFLLHKGDNIMEIKISCVHNYYGFKSTDTRSSFKLFNDGINGELLILGFWTIPQVSMPSKNKHYNQILMIKK